MILFKQEVEKAEANKTSSPAVINLTEESPQKPMIDEHDTQGSGEHEAEGQDVVQLIPAEIEKPPSTLDVIEEEADEEPSRYLSNGSQCSLFDQ